MRITNIQSTYNTASFGNRLNNDSRKEDKYEFLRNERDVFEYSGDYSDSGFFNKCKNFLKSKKVNIKLMSSPKTERGKKALQKDPIAFSLMFSRPYTGDIVDDRILTKIPVQNRKTNEQEELDFRRVILADESAIYTIEQGKDKLATVDTTVREKSLGDTSESIYINYATTTVGMEDYRNLLPTAVQAIVEDYIRNNEEIPLVEATPDQIGNQKFDRLKLYKYYGAERRLGLSGGYLVDQAVLYPHKLAEMLEKIKQSSNKSFVFPETESKLSKAIAKMPQPIEDDSISF